MQEPICKPVISQHNFMQYSIVCLTQNRVQDHGNFPLESSRNEIVRVQQKMAVRKKEAVESG